MADFKQQIPDQPIRPAREDDFELLQMGVDLKDAKFDTPPIGFFKDAMLRLARNKAAVAALVLILLISFMAIFGPMMTPYTFDQQFVDYLNMPPKIPFLASLGIADGSRVLTNRRVDGLNDTEKYPEGCILEITNEHEVNGVMMADVKVDYYAYTGCEETFWFGSDYLGRDLWARLWRGARVSLFIAIVSVVTNMIIGVVYGSIAGYYGGKVDMVLMRICEIIQSFPRVVVVTLFIMFFGTGIFSIVMSLLIPCLSAAGFRPPGWSAPSSTDSRGGNMCWPPGPWACRTDPSSSATSCPTPWAPSSPP